VMLSGFSPVPKSRPHHVFKTFSDSMISLWIGSCFPSHRADAQDSAHH
jgi:hypothetical protein